MYTMAVDSKPSNQLTSLDRNVKLVLYLKSKVDFSVLKKLQAMKAYGGVDLELNTFLALALFGNLWLASCPSCLVPVMEVCNIQWMASWVYPTTDLNTVEKRNVFHCQELNPVSQILHSIA
jgi:hypothetical protein